MTPFSISRNCLLKYNPFLFSFLGTLPAGVTASGGTNGTRTNNLGNIVATSAPRFDYDPSTLQAKGILVEPSSTNLVFPSATATGGTWTPTGLTITTGQSSPDGLTNGALIAANGSSSLHKTVFTLTVGSGATVSYSAYVKIGAGTLAALSIGTTNAFGIIVDTSIATGTTFTRGTGVLVSSSITPISKGWLRVVVTGSIPATTSYPIAIGPASSTADGPGITYTGSQSINVFGLQLEAAPTASTYIPTTTAALTRTPEVISFTIPTWVHKLVYTFSGFSTQTIAVSSGAYIVPTTVNQSVINSIRGFQ